jgi:hypothetical protein
MEMVPISHKKITLYEEAKAGLVSLVQQTATVFISFVVMLLVTGGAPSGFIVALSFCLGTAFVAWSEQRRITKIRMQSLSNYSEILDKNVQSNETSEQSILKAEELVSQPAKMGEIKYAKSIEELRRMNEVTRLDKENWEKEDRDEKQLDKENLKEKYRDKKHWNRERKSPRGSFGYVVPWTHDYETGWRLIKGGTATVEVHHSKSGQMYVVGFVENRTLTRLINHSGDGEITIKISWEISKSFGEVVAIPTNKIVSIDEYDRHRKDFKLKKIGYEKSWDKQDASKDEQDSHSDWNQEDWDENDDYSIMIVNKYK